MTRARMLLPLTAAVLAAVIATGCGSGTKPTTPPGTAATRARTTTTTPGDPRAQLEAAARQAIRLNHRESVRALWTNHVPTHPAATAGPALAQWRRSTAVARRRGIRVRMVSERFRLVSLRLDPSYRSATAVVHDDQRVRPSHPNGKPLGRSVVLHEHARLELHRIGDSDRFVVWSVQGLKP